MADAEATLRITAEVNQAISELTRLRQSYISGNAQWSRSTKEVSDAINRFSGDAIIRQAQTYAQSVQAMGGVTKLTAREQGSLNRVVTEAIEKYRALGQQAPKSLLDLQRATKQGTTTSSAFFDALFFKITGGVAAGTLLANGLTKSFEMIIGGIGKVAAAFGELIQRGDKVSNIRLGFDQLAAGIGVLSEVELVNARKATQGLVTDFDLMSSANRAMMFGIDISGNKFGQLAVAAKQLGRAMGLTAQKSLDDLILALGRVSPRILDNIGIIVKVGEANNAWSKATGRSIESMTGQERVLAFSNMAIQRMTEKLGTMGDVQLNVADNMTVLQNYMQNFIDQISMAVVRSPVLITMLSRIGQAFGNALGDKQLDATGMVVNAIETLSIWLVRAAEMGVDFALKIRATWGITLGVVMDMAVGVMRVSEGLLTGISGLVKFAATLQPFNSTFRAAAAGAVVLAQSMTTAREATERSRETIAPLITGQDKLTQALGKTKIFLHNLGNEMEKARGTTLKFTPEARQAKEELEETGEVAEGLGKKLGNLNAILAKIEPTQRNITLVTEEYGTQIKDLTNKAELSKIAIPAAISAWLARITEFKNKADLSDILESWDKFRQGLIERGLKSEIDANRKRIDDEQSTSDRLKNIYDDYQAKLNESSEKGVTARLAKVEYERLQAMQKIGAMPPWWDANRANWEKAANVINAHYNQVKDNVLEADAQAKESMKRTFSKDLVTLFEDIPKIVQKGLTGGGGWKGIGAAVASKIGATFAGGQVTNLLSGAFKGLFGKSVSDALGDKVGGLVGSIAKSIPGIGGAIGALAAPLIGKIFKKIAGPENWEKVAKDTGKAFGMKMSDSLAKQIDADAKKFKMSNWAASIFNLDKIIAEAGGLNSGNFNKFLGNLGEVFTLVKQGKMDVDKARETLDKNFGAFAEHLTKSGKLASKEFLAILDANAKSGMQSVEIAKFVSSQLVRASNALSKPLDSIIERYGKLSTEIEELTKKESLNSEESKRLIQLQEEKAASSARAFQTMERAGTLVLASFNAAIAKGVSWIEAINAVSPALDKIVATQKTLGVESQNAAIQELIRYRNLANQHKDLVEEATSLNEALLAMSNIGALNTDTLLLMGNQAGDTNAKLLAAGFTQREALMMQKGALETLIQAHKDLGVPMDENTQRLVDAAREQGILKEQGMSTNDILAEGLGAIIELLGGKLPEAFKKMRDGLKEGVDGVGEFQRRGEEAGRAVGDAIGNVGDRARSIRDRLAETNIQDWAARAAEAVERLGDEVDAVTFGHSPGGLKEYVPKLRESLRAFHEFSTGAVKDLSKVSAITDEIALGGIPDYEASLKRMGKVSLDIPGMGPNSERILENHIHIMGMDNRELRTFVQRTGQENFADRKWTVPQDVILDIGARPY